MKSFTEKRSGVGETNKRNLCQGNGKNEQEGDSTGKSCKVLIKVFF
jgi:hypothetical protein